MVVVRLLLVGVSTLSLCTGDKVVGVMVVFVSLVFKGTVAFVAVSMSPELSLSWPVARRSTNLTVVPLLCRCGTVMTTRDEFGLTVGRKAKYPV